MALPAHHRHFSSSSSSSRIGTNVSIISHITRRFLQVHFVFCLFLNGVKLIRQAWYWLPGFLDPWASRTHDPRFWRTMAYRMYTIFFFFFPHGQSILPLCESEVKHLGSKGCVTCQQPHTLCNLLPTRLLTALLFSLIEVQSLVLDCQ